MESSCIYVGWTNLAANYLLGHLLACIFLVPAYPTIHIFFFIYSESHIYLLLMISLNLINMILKYVEKRRNLKAHLPFWSKIIYPVLLYNVIHIRVNKENKNYLFHITHPLWIQGWQVHIPSSILTYFFSHIPTMKPPTKRKY